MGHTVSAGCRIVGDAELTGEGVSWGMEGGSFTLQTVMVILAVDAVILFLLAVYVNAVFPG